MAPPTEISSIRSPVSAEAPTPAAAAINVASETLSSLTPGAVGQVFQAQLLSQLEDGTFVVNVAQNALRMSLPAGSTVGETLNMTLLATEPRPAFLLDQQNSGTSASLSSAAKLINTALQTAQQAGAPTTLVGKTPIVATPQATTPALADALKNNIDFSGVFYESHVGQWVNGDRPLADLLREPQVQAQEALPPAHGRRRKASAAGMDATGTAGTLLPRPPVSEEQLTNQVTSLLNAVRSNPTSNAASTTAASGAQEARTSLAQTLSTILSGNNLPKEADVLVREPTMTQQNAQTINLQLNTLEQNRIVWQGELWPGQRMEWEINEDGRNRGQGGAPDGSQAAWQSVVRFELPKLGKVSATIHLTDGHVRMQVQTPDQSVRRRC